MTFRVSDDLWQAKARDVIEIAPFDVIFWMKASPPKAVFGENTVIDFPIPDDDQGIPQERLMELWALTGAVKRKKVLTVCQAGQNRSGLASAMILMHRGLSAQQAIMTVQAQNGALWNEGFVRQLYEIERSRAYGGTGL